MWNKRIKNLFWIVLLALAIGIQLWDESSKPSKSATATSAPGTEKAERPSTTQAAPRSSAKGFEVITGAKWTPHRNNDGDSFLVSHEGQQYELRLYFVDAPEKRLHQYNGERIDHQGRYFGHRNREQTMAIGLQATSLIEQLLTTRPFRIETRWQPVFDSGRFYAFVFLEDSNEELSEILVREGLARIYTEGTNLPDGRKRTDFERHLKKLEATAKAQQKGGWK